MQIIRNVTVFAFLEGGLGETILWHPKNGSPQKTLRYLNNNVRYHTGGVQSTTLFSRREAGTLIKCWFLLPR